MPCLRGDILPLLGHGRSQLGNGVRGASGGILRLLCVGHIDNADIVQIQRITGSTVRPPGGDPHLRNAPVGTNGRYSRQENPFTARDVCLGDTDGFRPLVCAAILSASKEADRHAPAVRCRHIAGHVSPERKPILTATTNSKPVPDHLVAVAALAVVTRDFERLLAIAVNIGRDARQRAAAQLLVCGVRLK